MRKKMGGVRKRKEREKTMCGECKLKRERWREMKGESVEEER